jgi:hypothetical protein
MKPVGELDFNELLAESAELYQLVLLIGQDKQAEIFYRFGIDENDYYKFIARFNQVNERIAQIIEGEQNGTPVESGAPAEKQGKPKNWVPTLLVVLVLILIFKG